MAAISRENTDDGIASACRVGDAKYLRNLLDNMSESEREDFALKDSGDVKRLPEERLFQHICAKAGTVDCLEVLIKKLGLTTAHLDSHNASGCSCLHLAVKMKKYDMVTFLIKQKVELNSYDTERHTPIYHAVSSGDEKLVRTLLSAGASVNRSDVYDARPIHYAVQECDEGNEEASTIVELLLKASRKSVNHPDNEGRTPVIWASSAGSHKAVQILLKYGADGTIADQDGLTALHCAASRGYNKIVELLVNECKDLHVNVEDKYGCTPLFYAASHNQPTMIRSLLSLGANPDHQDRKGRTTSHCAAALGYSDILYSLEERGANLWIKSNKDEYPLHETLNNEHTDAAFHLCDRLDHSVEINQQTKEGSTLLHLAAKMGNESLIDYLIDRKADINSLYTSKDGVTLTALDICDEKGYQACSKLLKKHGANSNTSRPHSARNHKEVIKIPVQNGPGVHHENKENREHRSPKRVTIQPHGKQEPRRHDHQQNSVSKGQNIKTSPHVHHIPNERTIQNQHHTPPYERTTPNGYHSQNERPSQNGYHTSPYERTAPTGHNAPTPHNKYRSPVELEPDQPHYNMPPKVNPYLQTLLPYDKSNSSGFVNINSHIRRPKSSKPATRSQSPNKTAARTSKIRGSVMSFEGIRRSARAVQEDYLKQPRPLSAHPVKLRQTQSEPSTPPGESSSGSVNSEPPSYTVVATRGGFTKIRNPPENQPACSKDILRKLHQGKGNGILYVVDIQSKTSVGFTQGFDGRLRPRTGLAVRPPSKRYRVRYTDTVSLHG